MISYYLGVYIEVYSRYIEVVQFINIHASDSETTLIEMFLTEFHAFVIVIKDMHAIPIKARFYGSKQCQWLYNGSIKKKG